MTAGLIACFAFALGFNPPSQERDGIRLALSVERVTEEGDLVCTVENRGGEAVSGIVTLSACPPWEILPGPIVRVQVGAGKQQRTALRLKALSAVFPEFSAVRAKGEFQRGGRSSSLGPVLVFKPDVPWPPGPSRGERAPIAAIGCRVSSIQERW